MPYFRVLLEGRGLAIPSGDEPIVGFFTTRWVRAQTSDEAKRLTPSLVLYEWEEGEYARHNEGGRLTVSVDTVRSVGWLNFVWNQPGRGYTFYPADAGDAHDSNA
ncbi:MAG: hypothetical protein AAF351_06860 [Pseudomonadota bacterium]